MSDADMDAMFPLMTDQELDALLGNDSEDDSEVGAGEAGVAADPPADKPGP